MASLDFSSLQVLVVDDEAFIRKTIIRTLQEIGVDDIIFAEDGYGALAKIEVYGKNIDVILCDLQMPNLDGFGFLIKLRKLKDPLRARIPVLFLTGNSEVENIEMAIRIGISGFLVKPLSKQSLEFYLNKAVLEPMIDQKSLDA